MVGELSGECSAASISGISCGKKGFKYRAGPQPADLGGQRALDFVMDNSTLQDFNRTLLFDVKLISVRSN